MNSFECLSKAVRIEILYILKKEKKKIWFYHRLHAYMRFHVICGFMQ